MSCISSHTTEGKFYFLKSLGLQAEHSLNALSKRSCEQACTSLLTHRMPFTMTEVYTFPSIKALFVKYVYIYICTVNSWEWTQNILHKPVKKGSKSLGSCQHVFCWMQQKEVSKANISVHKERCLRFPFPQHKGSPHTFKDPVTLLFAPNSYPANSTVLLYLCFSSVTGIVYRGAPEVCSQTEHWDHS